METRLSFAGTISSVVHIAKLSRKIGTRPAVLLEMALRKRFAPGSAKLVELTLPGFPSPFYLRAGTTDAGTFLNVIVNAEYNIRLFPQFQTIDRLYKKARADGKRPLIIDCGANIGLSTVWFSHLFPEAQIIAVEPAADNIEVAKRNLHAYPNVTLIQGAIWDRPARLTISDTTAATDAYRVQEAQEKDAGDFGNTLKTFTIPELIDMADADHAMISQD